MEAGSLGAVVFAVKSRSARSQHEPSFVQCGSRGDSPVLQDQHTIGIEACSTLGLQRGAVHCCVMHQRARPSSTLLAQSCAPAPKHFRPRSSLVSGHEARGRGRDSRDQQLPAGTAAAAPPPVPVRYRSAARGKRWLERNRMVPCIAAAACLRQAFEQPSPHRLLGLSGQTREASILSLVGFQ